MSHYTNSPLHVQPIGKRNYRLLSPIIWQLHYGSDDMVCVIPNGFETDFDSTPWWARPLLRGRHLARKAHALHDWGYNRGWVWCSVHEEIGGPNGDGWFGEGIMMLTRSEWDIIWRDAMQVEGMNSITARAMYQALKAFGFIRWNQCKYKREQYFNQAQLELRNEDK